MNSKRFVYICHLWKFCSRRRVVTPMPQRRRRHIGSWHLSQSCTNFVLLIEKMFSVVKMSKRKHNFKKHVNILLQVPCRKCGDDHLSQVPHEKGPVPAAPRARHSPHGQRFRVLAGVSGRPPLPVQGLGGSQAQFLDDHFP